MADNFFRNMFRHQREAAPGIPSSTTDTGDTPTADTTAKGGNWLANVVTPGGERSLMVPTWYRCVTLIMQTMGQLVTQSQKLNMSGGNFVEDKHGAGRRLNYLLQVRPNPLMSASQLQEQVEFRRIYYGNAYVYIERDEFDDPIHLWLCTSGSYLPYTDEYQLTFPTAYRQQASVQTSAMNVLHYKNAVLSGDGIYGRPVIHFALKALQLSATGDEQALQDLAKGGKYKVLVQEQMAPDRSWGSRGRANRQELKKMTDEFATNWMANDVVLLDNVADAKVISQTAQQLQLLENRGYSNEDLIRLLGVPKIMAMIGEGGSYRMPEHATQEFLLRTIQPLIRNREDELNYKLIHPADFGYRRIHLCEQPLLRLDREGQSKVDLLQLQTGASSVNEIRSQYDRPAVEGGDRVFRTANVKGLDEVDTAKTLQPGNYNVPNPQQNDEGNEEGK